MTDERAEKNKEIDGLNDAYIFQSERAEKAENEVERLRNDIEFSKDPYIKELKAEVTRLTSVIARIPTCPSIIDLLKENGLWNLGVSSSVLIAPQPSCDTCTAADEDDKVHVEGKCATCERAPHGFTDNYHPVVTPNARTEAEK